MTIVEFMTARLDQEQAAWADGLPDSMPALGQLSRYMLDDIAAKRAIVALHHADRVAESWYWLERECAECGHRWHGSTSPGTPPTVIGPERGCPTVRLLASVYADHPDFDPKWADAPRRQAG